MDTPPDKDPEIELLEKHIAQLMEHFETVQIFVTRHDAGQGTFNINLGDGNFFARLGQVQEWITKSNELSKENVRRQDNEL